MTAPARQPHDALFRAVFSQVEHAAGLLATLVPTAFAARVDWNTLAVQPGTYVDGRLLHRYSDLLFSVRTRGGAALLYLLVEHESEPDRWMALRLHGYVHRIWEHWLREHGSATKLPAVLPIVVHHGAGGWTAAASLGELYDLDAEALEVLAPHLPELRFLLDDLGRVPMEELEERPITDLGCLVLLFLQRVRVTPDLAADVRRWMNMLLRVFRGRAGWWALNLLGQYTHAVTDEVPESLLAVLEEGLGSEGREAFMTAAEKLIEQGRAEGRAEVLLQQVAERFGAPNQAITERVRAAPAEQVDRWVKRILTASSLAELFD